MIILSNIKINNSENYSKKKNKVNIGLKYSKQTGLIELNKPSDYKKLVANHPAIANTEPEKHLKKISKLLLSKLNNQNSKVIGFSYKDIPLIEIINKSIKIHKNYNFTRFKNIEILQNILSNKKFFFHLKEKNIFDLIVIRHIWEHFYNLDNFIKNLKYISNQKTLLYIEVPDSYKIFRYLDYAMIWEHHLFYYMENSFKIHLNSLGLKCIKFIKIKTRGEDLLVALCTFNQKIKKNLFYNVNKNYNIIKKFKLNFFPLKKKYNIIFNNFSNKKIFLFGASHMAHVFLSIFNLETSIDEVIDDNKFKKNKFFLKTNKKIKGSDFLLKQSNCICILGINPASEQKLKKMIKSLIKKKIEIYSIFSTSKYSML